MTEAERVLHPGDVACASRGGQLRTLLGSCVAVILTDPRRSVGAMCHIVHAGPGGSTAHAGPAIDAMHALLRERAIEPRLCEAWVYGGGNMFPRLVRAGEHIGVANVATVLERLVADGTRVLHVDAGGAAYRRLAWTVGSSEPVVTAVAA